MEASSPWLVTSAPVACTSGFKPRFARLGVEGLPLWHVIGGRLFPSAQAEWCQQPEKFTDFPIVVDLSLKMGK